MTKKTNRQKAIANGDKFYFAKNKCNQAHTRKRYTASGECVKCKKSINSKRDLVEGYSEKHALYLQKRRDDTPGLAAHESAISKLGKRGKIAPGADLKEIFKQYELASLLTIITGTLYEVDHIIPLNGEEISGLHHQDNLQVITKRANVAKSNKYNRELNNQLN